MKNLIICPGIIKCGTTSLYDWLCESPEVTPHPNKEIHYFSYGLSSPSEKKHIRVGMNGRSPRSSNEYFNSFGLTNEGTLLDVSPSYMGWPETAMKIKEFQDSNDIKIKFIIATRDRLARILSSWKHARRAGIENESILKSYIRDRNECNPYEYPLRKYYQLSDYDSLISEYNSLFHENNVKVLSVEDFYAPKSASELSEFLGLHISSGRTGAQKSNAARYVGKNQVILKTLIKSKQITQLISSCMPKNKRIRELLYGIAYRGTPADLSVDKDEIEALKNEIEADFVKPKSARALDLPKNSTVKAS